jgi:hypothetical protein
MATPLKLGTDEYSRIEHLLRVSSPRRPRAPGPLPDTTLCAPSLTASPPTRASLSRALEQLSLRSTAARDVAVSAISNPTLTVQFERRSGQGAGAGAGAALLTLDAWVDVGALNPSANALADVCRRGFAVPDGGRGLEVAVGNIALAENGQGECGVRETGAGRAALS